MKLPYLPLLLFCLVSKTNQHSAWYYRICHKFSCPDKQFYCHCNNPEFVQISSKDNCIPPTSVCDGFGDCEDQSDEVNCTCPQGFFQCGSHKGGSELSTDNVYYCLPESKLCDGNIDCPSNRDEVDKCNKTTYFKCNSGEYISDARKCNGLIDCADGYSDESNCSTCPPDKSIPCGCNNIENQTFTCRGKGKYVCYNTNETCDGRNDCADNMDENNCPSCPTDTPYRCDCNQPGNNSCKGDNSCYSERDICDGWTQCLDRTDERNCTCSGLHQHRCACNRPGNNTCIPEPSPCYTDNERCDGKRHCTDWSDEKGCWKECDENQFACHCLKSTPPTCNLTLGCIPSSKRYDGNRDCPFDQSDESDIYRKLDCGPCNLTVHRLSNISECNKIGFPFCDNSTCYSILSSNCVNNDCTDTEVICTSNCPNIAERCKKIFQCADGNLFVQYEFCDDKIDCPDGSDEKRQTPGFKCSNESSCILPQLNLYDNISHCNNDLDLPSERKNTFTCFDIKLIISANQVCDGIIDCYDLSDECLCDEYFKTQSCKKLFLLNNSTALQCHTTTNVCKSLRGLPVKTKKCSTFSESSTTKSCTTKYQRIDAELCDGRPECRDFSDECNCNYSSKFCDDFCYSFYPLGDRYCDGDIDQAWKYINDFRCPEGFDERNCSHRFYCTAGSKINIDISKKCDGIEQCDDGSDEIECNEFFIQKHPIFSSDTEMIDNVLLRIIIWFMAFITLIGNSYVIATTCLQLKTAPKLLSEMNKCYYYLVLNLSCADFLMGIYLLIIAVKSVMYSGHYGEYGYGWTTSLACSIVGSISIISSETSCFMITLMTAFRLYNLRFPFSSQNNSGLIWKLSIPLAWFLSFALAFIPLFPHVSSYFVFDVFFETVFTKNSPVVPKSYVIEFTCRLTSLTNQTIVYEADTWQSTLLFLSNKFPSYSPKGEFGYYGETSVCLPRFFVEYGDNAWEYSLIIITINFISFLFVTLGYFYIYTISTRRSDNTKVINKENKEMQARIARLVSSDIVCWMPICIMAYLKLAGVPVPDTAYAFSAVVLLPINSALNPLLYSRLVKTISPFFSKKNFYRLGSKESALS